MSIIINVDLFVSIHQKSINNQKLYLY